MHKIDTKVPRVTEILKVFSGYDYVPKEVLERAALRGTTVHQVCAGLAKGSWIEKSLINKEYHGYIDSFKQWSQLQVAEYLIIEKRYYNEDEDLPFTGQVDFVVRGKDDKIYLVDIKTSASKQKTYPLQMAAYKHLLANHGVEIEAAFIVYLSKEGNFPEIETYEDLSTYTEIFLAALKCWQYFNKGRKRNDRQSLRRKRKKSSKHTPEDKFGNG